MTLDWSIARQMKVLDLLQELDSFSDKDCEDDISDIETFEIGDNNESKLVAAIEEDIEISHVSATTSKPGVGNSQPNEFREMKEGVLEIRDLITIFMNQAAKQVTSRLESTTSST